MTDSPEFIKEYEELLRKEGEPFAGLNPSAGVAGVMDMLTTAQSRGLRPQMLSAWAELAKCLQVSSADYTDERQPLYIRLDKVFNNIQGAFEGLEGHYQKMAEVFALSDSVPETIRRVYAKMFSTMREAVLELREIHLKENEDR
jgi:hypothetical protein